jgi:ATP-dependent protease Clp ATPase subunit
MYEVPSDDSIEVVKINADVVEGKGEPVFVKKAKTDNKAV